MLEAQSWLESGNMERGSYYYYLRAVVTLL